jgi:Protein of unknown function, DUF547
MLLVVVFFLSWTEGDLSSPSIILQPLPDHAVWTSALKKFVSSDGVVDYASWEKDQGPLDTYLAQATTLQPVANWSRNVQLSYWINLYNAATVKLILEHYPVRSIKDIDNGNPWDTPRIHIGTKTYSLNQIENTIIRQQFRDPRIHFALNCGARSCPPLLNEAYDPARLDTQLTARTQSFTRNPTFNRTDSSPIRISQLFDWYKGDFSPDVITFLNIYIVTPLSADEKIEYMEYDWGLNEE